MLSIKWSDVVSVLQLCLPYIIAIVVILAAAVVLTVVWKKKEKNLRKLLRSQTWLAAILAIVIVLNLVISGPLSSMVSLMFAESGEITEESTEEATALAIEIAEEGIVLLENDDDLLPLSEGKVNVFGWASTNPCYGGTGSGSLSDNYETVSLLDGLELAGLEYNTELTDFYEAYHDDSLPNVGMMTQDWTLPEPNVSEYTDEMIANAVEFSDIAIIVLSRVGGEGSDLPTDMTAVVEGTFETASTMTYDDSLNEGNDWDEGDHYLQLTNREEELVELVCENFDNVIIIYNGANTMELGWMEDYEEIKAALWCPGTGQSGFTALGEILTGAVNPSGKTADTVVADLTQTPTWNNSGYFVYDNMDEFYGTEGGVSFVNYVENIYVGYKFYETADDEGLIDYDELVTYPFGYGLSYTTFSQALDSMTVDDGTITLTVTVTNIGDVAGKDIVQVYYNPPYTNGGIEKASANLIIYDKTDTLEAGASQTLTLSFDIEDMASYSSDADDGNGAYVLEEGDYEISINSDAHTIIDSAVYTQDGDIVYAGDNKRESDEEAASNQFSDAAGDVTYLSRADGFANYDEATAAPTDFTYADKDSYVNASNYDPEDYNNDEDEMPTTGADNGLTLSDLRGLDYDDELWDDLLDQMTVDEYSTLISGGGYQTAEVSSIGKVQTLDMDGPANITNNYSGSASIGFPSSIMLAMTWNDDLAYRFGESIGTMADELGVSGWYAPALNTHRSAFSGRNFEYYSEDSILSGYMAANAVQGAASKGVYSYLKHFALNDQETNRYNQLFTWSTEQAIREIYLKGFEIAVKEGGATAVMAAYNYIGSEPAEASDALLNTVLRGEWGFRGMVETDMFGGFGFQDADRMIRNGCDLMLAPFETEAGVVTDQTSATSVLAMRQAAKNILYTTVNSRAYAEETSIGLAAYLQVMFGIDAIIAVILIALSAVAVMKYRRRRANAASGK